VKFWLTLRTVCRVRAEFVTSVWRGRRNAGSGKMPRMTDEQVKTWVEQFMTATSGGGGGTATDWKMLQDLMSKRVTVIRVKLAPARSPPHPGLEPADHCGSRCRVHRKSVSLRLAICGEAMILGDL